jgi:ATP-dependent DNA helicase RecQ
MHCTPSHSRSRAAFVPPYVVAHDRTLAEIACERPGSTSELAKLHGMGPARIARHG